MTSADRHVVLGAAGGIGGALVRTLRNQGLPTRAVTRRGDPQPGVETVAADVTDPDSLDRALQGAAVVYHAAQPAYTAWAREFRPMTAGIIAAAGRAGAKLVLADNLYMYGPVPGGYGPGTPAGPLHEDQPHRAEGTKGRVRSAMAADVLAVADRQPVTIGRLSDYYGPGGNGSATGAMLFEAARAGKAATWFVDADQPHTLSYLDDAARALVVLGTRPEADGRVFHLPAAPALTPREFIGLVYAEAGRAARVRVLPRWLLRLLAPVNRMVGELLELGWQVDRPYVLDASRFTETFGPFRPTPHREAVRATLDWFAARR